MKSLILYIDTSINTETFVSLKSDSDIKEIRVANLPRQPQQLLLLIDQILKDNNTTLKDLTEIQVNPGPGSFTGVRVGVAIANTLSQTLNIPLNGKNSLVVPIYA